MDKVKRCPFCGGEANVFMADTIAGMRGYVVECGDCGCRTMRLDRKMAVEKWNRRVDLDDKAVPLTFEQAVESDYVWLEGIHGTQSWCTIRNDGHYVTLEMIGCVKRASHETYGNSWRAWDKQPTEEQMKNEPWRGDFL